MNIILSSITIYSVMLAVRSGTWNDSQSLISDLLSGYDTRLRPVNDQYKPIKVNFSFDLMSIQDVNEVEGKLSVVGYMYLGWYDERLIWNSSDYGDTFGLMLPLKDVWHPIIVLANSFKRITDIGDDWMMVEIRSNGAALYVPGDVFTASCNADVTFYPFDYQTCYLHFVSWGSGSGKVSLNLWSPYVFKSHFTENGEWDLIEATPYRNPGRNQYEVDGVGAAITIKRRSTFLVVNVILPVVFMSTINILVFVLPTESGERVSFALTVLLSLAIFLTLVVNNLPKTSKPIAKLCYYLMFELVASVLMCIASIFNLRIFYMHGDVAVPKVCCRLCKIMCIKVRSSNCERNFLPGKGTENDKNGNTTTTLAISWRDVSRALDRLFLIFFLSVLILINAIYLSILSKNQVAK